MPPAYNSLRGIEVTNRQNQCVLAQQPLSKVTSSGKNSVQNNLKNRLWRWPVRKVSIGYFLRILVTLPALHLHGWLHSCCPLLGGTSNLGDLTQWLDIRGQRQTYCHSSFKIEFHCLLLQEAFLVTLVLPLLFQFWIKSLPSVCPQLSLCSSDKAPISILAPIIPRDDTYHHTVRSLGIRGKSSLNSYPQCLPRTWHVVGTQQILLDE